MKKKKQREKTAKPEEKKKREKRSGRSRFLRISFSPLWLILPVLLGGIYLGLRAGFGPGLGIYRVTRESGSRTMEVRARQLYQLSTVEFVWKTVFPHDFFPSGEDWDQFLEKKRNSPELTAGPPGWEELYALCRETGFSPEKNDTRFLVLTILVTAGYDFENTALARQEPDSPPAQPFLEIRENEIYLSPPEAKILNIVMEDPERETYPFPDARVSPQGLQKISRFVASRASELAENRRLLDRAGENGRSFLTKLFLEAGYSAVNFSEAAVK